MNIPGLGNSGLPPGAIIAVIKLGGGDSEEEMGPEQKEFRVEVMKDLNSALKDIKEITFTGRVNAQTGKIDLNFNENVNDYAMVFASILCQGRLVREIGQFWCSTYKWDEKRKIEAFNVICKHALELEMKFAKRDSEKI